jgi:uncharacterized protein (TIGR02588 family)
MSDDTPGQDARSHSSSTRLQGASSLPLGRSAAEWTTLLISLAIIGGLVGLVIWLSLSGGAEPPRFTVSPHLEAVRQEADRYALPVSVQNAGGQAAQDTRVIAELAQTGEGSPETAEFTIDVLAGGETQEGTMYFNHDPTAHQLSVVVESYR